MWTLYSWFYIFDVLNQELIGPSLWIPTLVSFIQEWILGWPYLHCCNWDWFYPDMLASRLSFIHGFQETIPVCFKCVWAGFLVRLYDDLNWFCLGITGRSVVGTEIFVVYCDSLPSIILVELCGHEFKLAFIFFWPLSSNCNHGTLFKPPALTATIVVVAFFRMLDILLTLKRAFFSTLSKKNTWKEK